MPAPQWPPAPDRCFDSDPARRALARSLYAAIKDLPLVCPHGHVDPALLADPNAGFGTPADLFIIPDHYIVRMLYSQGVPMQDLGVGGCARPIRGWSGSTSRTTTICSAAPRPGCGWPTRWPICLACRRSSAAPTRSGSMIIWRPSSRAPEFTPRALFERFNIEVLCTTDAATIRLPHHHALRTAGHGTNVRPTFRPDAVVNLLAPGWRGTSGALSAATGSRRFTTTPPLCRRWKSGARVFKALGATATDHAAISADSARLTNSAADTILQRGDVQPGQRGRCRALYRAHAA